MNTPSNDDLDLLAFRFIAGELSDDEREAFELRLGEEQAAREAVARAVELSQATLAAFESSAIDSLAGRSAASPLAELAPRDAAGSVWYHRLLWMTSGAAACLVALLAYQFSQSSAGPGPTAVGPTPTAEVARLAVAWSDAQESLREARAADVAEEPSGDVPEAEEALLRESDVVAMPEMNEMAETPSWVLAAVGAETGDESESSSENGVSSGRSN